MTVWLGNFGLFSVTILVIGISLYKDATTGSQKLESEFNKMVLKFLSVMSVLRALACKFVPHDGYVVLEVISI